MKKNSLQHIAGFFFALLLISCSSTPLSTAKTSSLSHQPSAQQNQTEFESANAAGIWNRLQPVSTAKLLEMQTKTQDPVQSAWIQLALVTKQKNIRMPELTDRLRAWRERHPTHPGNQLFPDNETLNQLERSTPPQHIAILLPQSGPYRSLGQSVRAGFLNAYYANFSYIGKQTIRFYDTSQNRPITAVYQQAIADGADFIIGPLIKENVQQLSDMRSLSTPTLALNYTNQNVRPANLYEFGLLPEDEIGQLADRANQAGRSRAIVIAPQDAWGQRLALAFSTRWQAAGGRIQATWYYSNKMNFNEDIARLLQVNLATDNRLMRKDNKKDILAQQRRHDFDVIFLFSQPQEARLIVPLLRYYYAGDIPIYANSSIYAGKSSPEKDADLSGVMVCDIPGSTISRAATTQAASADRLYAMGQDAYRLSQSLERLQNLPHFPIYGTTGALRLSSERQVHRRLPCTVIRHGRL